jgi:hypothetical protein
MRSSVVSEILSWYGGDNPGTLTNLARLLNHGRLAGTGKLVILPVDQGFEHGPARSFAPNPPGYDPATIFNWPSRRAAMLMPPRSDFWKRARASTRARSP